MARRHVLVDTGGERACCVKKRRLGIFGVLGMMHLARVEMSARIAMLYHVLNTDTKIQR